MAEKLPPSQKAMNARNRKVQDARDAIKAVEPHDVNGLNQVLDTLATRIKDEGLSFPEQLAKTRMALAIMTRDIDMIIGGNYSHGLDLIGLKHAIRDGAPYEQQWAAYVEVAKHVHNLHAIWKGFRIYLDWALKALANERRPAEVRP